MGENEYEEECAEIPKLSVDGTVGVWHGGYSLALYYIGFMSTWRLNEGQIGDTPGDVHGIVSYTL